MVLTMDLSVSMHCDSRLNTDNDSQLTLAQREVNLDAAWAALRAADPKWPGTSKSKFLSSFGRINSARGVYVRANSLTYTTPAMVDGLVGSAVPSPIDYTAVQDFIDLGLLTNTNPLTVVPFPQSGRDANGRYNPEPDFLTNFVLWYNYIRYMRNHSDATYQSYYGFRSLVDYLQHERPRRYEAEDLWRTPMQPVAAVKNGEIQFCTDLEQLGFGDRVGLSTYDVSARWVDRLNDDDLQFTLPDPFTQDFGKMRTLIGRRQPGEIESGTQIGVGIAKASEMLFGSGDQPKRARRNAVPMILLMTDGKPNPRPEFTMPSDFDWAAHTDFDGDGTPDYVASDSGSQHAIYEAVQVADQGGVIHTLAVGSGADVQLMRAIAKLSGGITMQVPGGLTAAQNGSLTTAAFRKFAAQVPPPKLIHDFSN